MEELLYKYIMEPASIIALPGAAKEPVQQPRRYGRFPKSIASLWDARRERWHRDEDLKKLRDKLRAINWQIDANQIVLTKEQARLIEVKKQIQELTK